jgi:uncharacterized protein (UPF0335 family)
MAGGYIRHRRCHCNTSPTCVKNDNQPLKESKMAKGKAHDPIETNLAETKNVRGIGDNSEKTIEGKKVMGFINELEKLDKKKDQVWQDIREIYADAKAVGFNGKIIRAIIKERKMEPEKRKEQAELMAVYKAAINMLDD